MKKLYLFHLFLILASFGCSKPQIGMTIQEAEMRGILFDSLNLLYKSIADVGSSSVVLTKDQEIENANLAYVKMIDDLKKYLKLNNYNWPFTVTCFHKVYFNKDGQVDYFLFNFLGEPPYKLTMEQELSFKNLLNDFLNEYKHPIITDESYSQCSTVLFGDE